MPKQSPVPDEMTKPFWDACNEGRLIMQACKACDYLQYPPEPECFECKSSEHLEWREMSGRGKIRTYGVVHDCPVKMLQIDQPFNVALIALEEDPEIVLYSHLPGVPVDEVPVGASVRVIFQETPSTGQKVPEWEVVN
ncbi:MAG: OB-fold domain-containing protein [Dehalococcoidia bacterium]|nr:hypothetical protein [Chloroflexota bacterium]MCH2525668.1 OB-fold domain-containing protein [Dehalococcoidia bacterium]MQG00578.1 hypothetical protein [SAR202 cluster bacterium]|tara:strand:- start:532 stop:945 length:414 start_codon:yes stop_codon:yes gene_type:complete